MVSISENIFRKYLSLYCDLSPSTIETSLAHFRLLKKLFGRKKLNLKNSNQILMDLKMAGKSSNYRGTLRYIIAKACQYKRQTWYKKLPSIKRRRKDIPRTLTPEQIEQLYSFPIRKRWTDSDKRWNLLIELLAKTGMRRGEALGLKPDCFDFNKTPPLIMIKQSKTEPRIIPVPPDMINKLKDWIKTNGVLFPNFKTEVNRAMARRGKRLGWTLRPFPHMLRHSFITALLQEDVSIIKVMRLVGHKKLATTQAYTHLIIKDLVEAQARHPLIRKSEQPANILKRVKETFESFKLDKRFNYQLSETGKSLEIKISY